MKAHQNTTIQYVNPIQRNVKSTAKRETRTREMGNHPHSALVFIFLSSSFHVLSPPLRTPSSFRSPSTYPSSRENTTKEPKSNMFTRTLISTTLSPFLPRYFIPPLPYRFSYSFISPLIPPIHSYSLDLYYLLPYSFLPLPHFQPFNSHTSHPIHSHYSRSITSLLPLLSPSIPPLIKSNPPSHYPQVSKSASPMD